MRILVTGGTGFLGSRLVEKLAGNDVTVFARSQNNELKAKFIPGDITKKDELAKAFAKADVVYHLAANLDESDRNMHDENVEGTKNVVELSKEHNIRQLIFMGSCGALGDVRIAEEDAPYNPKTRYEKSKAESEKIIINSGAPYTIIRAPVIIGPNQIWLKIFEAAKKKYPLIGSGKNHFHLAYVNDVVDLLALAKDRKEAENQIFHVATRDVPTYKDVYRMLCEAIGVEMTSKHVPVVLFKTIAALHTFSRKIRGKKPSLTMMRSSIDRLIRDRTISIEKAKDVLGFSPMHDTQTAIKETAEYFKSKGLLYENRKSGEIYK